MAEKEYIEREAVINEINNLLSEYEDCDGKFLPKHLIPSGLCRALIFIKQQPTADVQEVLRCKDCAWGKYDDDLNMILCKRIYNLSDGECVYNDLNDFCSYGAKMDKE